MADVEAAMPIAPTPSEYEFRDVRNGGYGIPKKYDWDRLLDGNTYICQKGVHFFVSKESFSSYVRNQMRRRFVFGMVEYTRDGHVAVQMTRKMTDGEKAAAIERLADRRATHEAVNRLTAQELAEMRRVIASGRG